jgi:prefoldin subunit 5
MDDLLEMLTLLQNQHNLLKRQGAEIYQMLLELQSANVRIYGFDHERTQEMEIIMGTARRVLAEVDLDSSFEYAKETNDRIRDYHERFCQA